ncbi:MAG: sugar phosphate isomerase/epimerase [Clostridia bacterium]|nr:sugar phosphate isomerase/epimerase [Clostridia bacterium]
MKYTNYLAFRDDCRLHGIEYAAARSVRLGFDSVEFLDICPFSMPLYQSMDMMHVKHTLTQNGLTVACYSLAADLLTSNQVVLKDQLRRHIEFSAEVGAPYFHHTLAPVLSIGKQAPSYPSVLNRVLETAVWIAEQCANYGLTCLYEPQGMYFNGVEGLQTLYQNVGKVCKNVGICGDVGNSLFVDVSANEIYDAFAKDIRHVHIKDYLLCDRMSKDQANCFLTRGGQWISECSIGEGVTDFSYCFDWLRRVNYDAAIAFEISGNDETLMRALRYIQSMLLCK